jgi:tRNA (cmo5U34)-methyltransferase
MRKDMIFRKGSARGSDFEFSTEVAEVFNDMILRSVPFYLEQQNMVKEMAKKFYLTGTKIYDLGFSTGTTLLNLANAIGDCAELVGYDNSIPMIKKANKTIKEKKLDKRIQLRHCDLNGDLSKFTIENASVVTMCWTLQFIRPLRRDALVKWVHDGMVENGTFMLTEKVLTNSSHMNRFFIDFYYNFKSKNKYSKNEIMRKREALENVLIPYRIDENIELFRRNGFKIVETFFQWYNFAGFLCIKKS